MPEGGIRDFVAGCLRITVEYRRTDDDEGPTIRVFGRVGDEETQVLRFDCFQSDPHYHYDPQGSNEQHDMEAENIRDPVEWTLHRLERDLPDMIRRAGYGSLADQVNSAQVAGQMDQIRDTMASFANQPG